MGTYRIPSGTDPRTPQDFSLRFLISSHLFQNVRKSPIFIQKPPQTKIPTHFKENPDKTTINLAPLSKNPIVDNFTPIPYNRGVEKTYELPHTFEFQF